jgi:hypothetical protein
MTFENLSPVKGSLTITGITLVNLAAATVDKVNWNALGTALAVAFIAFMQVWQQYQSSKRAVKLEEVHKLVNSSMGQQLFIGMVAAEALHVAQPNTTNEMLAKNARAKYEEHQKKQNNVDATATAAATT